MAGTLISEDKRLTVGGSGVEPGQRIAGIGYVGCKREEKAFRPTSCWSGGGIRDAALPTAGQGLHLAFGAG